MHQVARKLETEVESEVERRAALQSVVSSESHGDAIWSMLQACQKQLRYTSKRAPPDWEQAVLKECILVGGHSWWRKELGLQEEDKDEEEGAQAFQQALQEEMQRVKDMISDNSSDKIAKFVYFRQVADVFLNRPSTKFEIYALFVQQAINAATQQNTATVLSEDALEFCKAFGNRLKSGSSSLCCSLCCCSLAVFVSRFRLDFILDPVLQPCPLDLFFLRLFLFIRFLFPFVAV